MCAYNIYLGVALSVVLLSASVIQVQGGDERVLKLRKFEKIQQDEKAIQSSLSISEPDAEDHRTISGELKTLLTIDNEWKVNITVLRKDSSEKDYSMFKDVPIMGACELMDTYYRRFFYDTLKDYSNAPHPDNCPLAPTELQIKDYPLNASMLKKLLTPGFYLLNGQVLKDDEIKIMYMAELQVE
ncbi:uncharacterized protein LOC6564379 [Drosophila grimshawi]|uniref:GH19041 n=1 Tax=Drosophila grimshawi TaxID=7222 RepID=B4JI66_DROGR|nr:uncharacterized protein LOC6564379 [Drosophila grimshawi]EDV92947.1 GH19041 [Drosophila grimshawi]